MHDGPLDFLAGGEDREQDIVASAFDARERDAFPHAFPLHAHDGQLPPAGDWRVWLIMAGRGFGKTRAGAEWVRTLAEGDPRARIALVAANLGEARSVMVEGDSGIMACAPPHCRPVYEPSLRRLRWPNGAEAVLFSAAEPESLRGPQHSHAWCDEVAKWSNSHGKALATWNNLQLGLRLGRDQRVLATTTPRAVPLVRQLLEGEDVAVTRGTTEHNRANLPRSFLTAMEREFGGTQLARQELDGELLQDIEGALWNRALLERCRENAPPAPARRVVIGVDPPASAKGDACGIVVAQWGEDGLIHVRADCSVERASPERWARAVAEAALVWEADRVVAEANQGGAMVASVLRAADIALPVMGPSPSLIFEPTASLTLELDAASMELAPATIAMLAQGANRLLVGQEIVEFADVEPIGERRWRLSGLLRGRGGTEAAAQSGHVAGARAFLLDDALIALDGTAFDPATSQIAAIGLGDDTHVTAEIERPGLARRPLSPVHPAARVTSGGGLALGWTRRARGGWHWPDGVDLPLVEQSEQYEVGVGDAAAPLALWACSTPRFEISSADLSALRAQSADAPIWVRQIGTYGKSASLLLTTLA